METQPNNRLQCVLNFLRPLGSSSAMERWCPDARLKHDLAVQMIDTEAFKRVFFASIMNFPGDRAVISSASHNAPSRTFTDIGGPTQALQRSRQERPVHDESTSFGAVVFKGTTNSVSHSEVMPWSARSCNRTR